MNTFSKGKIEGEMVIVKGKWFGKGAGVRDMSWGSWE